MLVRWDGSGPTGRLSAEKVLDFFAQSAYNICNWRKLMNTDFIYYLMLDGEIQDQWIFRTEEEAEIFALQQEFKDYHVLKWSVD